MSAHDEGHTPGEWRAQAIVLKEGRTPRAEIDYQYEIVPVGIYTPGACVVGGHASPHFVVARIMPGQHALADAALIGASKDLLAACDEALAQLGAFVASDDDPLNESVQMISHAILKARGRP